jgi:hypothetical protein
VLPVSASASSCPGYRREAGARAAAAARASYRA